jgi:8-oxo-dGTP diphosphatase
LRTRVFTTGVLMRGKKLLILRRKPDDDTYPGVWDCVGGHLKDEETAEDCMIREAKEESGLTVRIVRAGSPIEFSDQYGRAIALPFILGSRSGKVSLTEHSEYRWVSLEDLKNYDVVPDLTYALRAFKLERRG